MDALYLNVLSAKNNNMLDDYTIRAILLKVLSAVTHSIIMQGKAVNLLALMLDPFYPSRFSSF